MIHILPGRPAGKPDQMSPIHAAVPGVGTVLDLPDLGRRLPRNRLGRRGKRIEGVDDSVEQVASLAVVGKTPGMATQNPSAPSLIVRTERTSRGVCSREAGPPRLDAFAVAVIEGNQLLGAVGAHAYHHEQADLPLVQAGLEGEASWVKRPGFCSVVRRSRARSWRSECRTLRRLLGCGSRELRGAGPCSTSGPSPSWQARPR